MNLTQIISDYFTFSRSEQRGIIVLLSILGLLVVAYAVVPAIIPAKPSDFSSFEKEIAAFQKAMRTEDSIQNIRNRNNLKHGTGMGYFSKDSISAGRFKPREIPVIELNRADTFDLQQLRGIGSSFAKRIVNYRDRLGGFTDKQQLMEVFGMDSVRYNAIKASLTVNKDSIHKININNIAFKDLMKHPYFPFGMTKAIILYRKDHKVIRDLDELKTIPGICDSIYRKIKVYLKTE